VPDGAIASATVIAFKRFTRTMSASKCQYHQEVGRTTFRRRLHLQNNKKEVNILVLPVAKLSSLTYVCCVVDANGCVP
jgi:hypothetical protein